MRSTDQTQYNNAGVIPVRYGQVSYRHEQSEDAVLETVNRLLCTTTRENRLLALALVYVDGLTYANFVYGQHFREKLLEQIYDTLHGVIRANDIIGWLHKDTVVIALPGCSGALVENRLSQGNARLNLLNYDEPFFFHYGIAESSEVNAAKADCNASPLLHIAERRLREKRLSYILSC